MRKEEMILSALTHDIDFVKKVIPHIKADFFHDSSEKLVYNLVSDFYEKYSTLASKDVLSLQLSEAKNVPENEFEAAKQVLKSAFADTYEYDRQWLIDETETFCKERAVYNAISQSVLIINGEDKKRNTGQIPGMLQDALSISFDHALGHDYFTDALERFKFYNKKESKIPCSIELLNKVMNGGVNRKTLNMVVAQPKGGKSLALCSLAADYLKQGLSVLYITLELAEERVGERIDANLFNVNIRDINTIEESVFMSKVESIKSKTHGKLKIKEYPTKTASASQFKVLLDDYKIKENFVPDVMIVDYLGITASKQYKDSGTVNSYTYQKAVSEELRALGVEYNMAVWTALQTNRSGTNTSDFDIEHISDSSGPIMTCDFAMGIIRTPELDELNQQIVKQLASRYGDPSYYKRFLVGVDRSRMKLFNLEETAQSALAKDIDEPKVSETNKFKKFNGASKKVNTQEWEF